MAKILIVDDDRDITKSMSVILESKGYEIVSAESGEEGIGKVEESPPDLIILDIMMETKDKGFDVARYLKGSESYKHIPIIMLTSIKDKLGFDFSQEAGDEVWLPVDDYCEKPLKPQELIDKVKGLLSAR